MWARSEIFNLSSHPCNPARSITNHTLHVCIYLARITTAYRFHSISYVTGTHLYVFKKMQIPNVSLSYYLIMCILKLLCKCEYNTSYTYNLSLKVIKHLKTPRV